jgi:hypothetical protein
MNDSADRLKEKMDAEEAYKELNSQYVSVDAVVPGQDIKRPPKVLTVEALEFLKAAETRKNEAHNRYMESMRG